MVSFVFLDEAKDIFRDTGGLQSVLDTVTTTKYGEVTEAGLYCLGSAVEKNGEPCTVVNVLVW